MKSLPNGVSINTINTYTVYGRPTADQPCYLNEFGLHSFSSPLVIDHTRMETFKINFSFFCCLWTYWFTTLVGIFKLWKRKQARPRYINFDFNREVRLPCCITYNLVVSAVCIREMWGQYFQLDNWNWNRNRPHFYASFFSAFAHALCLKLQMSAHKCVSFAWFSLGEYLRNIFGDLVNSIR